MAARPAAPGLRRPGLLALDLGRAKATLHRPSFFSGPHAGPDPRQRASPLHFVAAFSASPLAGRATSHAQKRNALRSAVATPSQSLQVPRPAPSCRQLFSLRWVAVPGACGQPQAAHSRCQASRRHSPCGCQGQRRHSACGSVRSPTHPPMLDPLPSPREAALRARRRCCAGTGVLACGPIPALPKSGHNCAHFSRTRFTINRWNLRTFWGIARRHSGGYPHSHIPQAAIQSPATALPARLPAY